MADEHNFNENKSTLQEPAQHTTLPAGPHSGRGTLYDGLGEAPPEKDTLSGFMYMKGK